MAWNVLIPGGGFGGLYAARAAHGFPASFLARSYHLAMMPGIKRQLRLVVDWTVDLLFARDASELGRLGHPPALEMPREGGSEAAQTVPR